jgi:hypothetical protein
VGILNEDIALNDFPRNRRPTGIIPGQSEYRASRELWAKVPPFFYSPPDLQWSIGAQWPGVFIPPFHAEIVSNAAHKIEIPQIPPNILVLARHKSPIYDTPQRNRS